MTFIPSLCEVSVHPLDQFLGWAIEEDAVAYVFGAMHTSDEQVISAPEIFFVCVPGPKGLLEESV